MSANPFYDSARLPSPSPTGWRIVKLVEERVDRRKLCAVLEEDPATTLEMIKRANSSFYGPADPNNKVTTVLGALSRLSDREIVAIAIGFRLIKENKKGVCRTFDYQMFWQECLARAAAARHITPPRGKGFTDHDAFTVALLSEIGRLAFAIVEPERYAQILKEAEGLSRQQLRKIELREFQMHHYELTAEVISNAGMPELFRNAVEYQDCLCDEDILPHESPERSLAQVINWSGLVWDIMSAESACRNRKDLDDAIELAEELGMPREQFPEEFDRIVVDWFQLGDMLGVDTPEVPCWEQLSELIEEP